MTVAVANDREGINLACWGIASYFNAPTLHAIAPTIDQLLTFEAVAW